MTSLEKLEELIYKGFKETDRKMRESSRETDREIKETQKEIRETQKEIRETQKEIKQMRETVLQNSLEMRRRDKKMERVDENLRKITDSLGRFAENMVAPAVEKLFNEKGIPITDYAQRVRSKPHDAEYDVVAFNKEYVVVVSVKMTLGVSDVKDFLNNRLPIFKNVFPRYKDMKVVGAVTGASLVGESDKYGMKRGLYVLTQSGENMTVLNDDNFEAKIY
jgi:hypothetical protein